MSILLLTLAAGLTAIAEQPAPVSAPAPLIQPASRRARASRPLISLFTMDDYPNEAFEGQIEGAVEVRLNIGRDGAPTRCAVTRSSNSAPLDRASCRILMERARFTPASDAAGRPVEDYTDFRISWRLPQPDDHRNPFIALRIFTEITVAADGSVRCRERLNAYDYGPIEEPCGDLAELDPRSLLGGPGRAGTVTLILAILPDGAAPQPGDGVERGAPLLEGAARLSVAATGRVADCRMTRRPDPRDDAGLAQLADLCRLPSFDMENLFRPEPLPDAVRSATLTLQLYIRRAPD